MITPKARFAFSRLAAFALGGIFLLAAFSKIGDIGAFQTALYNMTFLPVWMKGLAIFFVPGLEVSLGIYLLAGISPRQTALIAQGLLVVFLIISIYSQLAGYQGDCGCFGVFWLKWDGRWIFLRDIGLLTLAGLIYWNEPPQDPAN
jgi:uncharacterized membrane protein YphA (DoxX/SURF4 family)